MRQPQKPTAAEQQILSLGHILQSLREEDNVDVLIETTISYLTEQFDYSLIWIALYDRLNHILLGRGGVAPEIDTRFLQQRLVLSPGDLLEQVVIEQCPLSVADLRAATRADEWRELAQKFNIQGTVLLPIRYKDRCLGLVLLGSQQWGHVLNEEPKARLMMVLGELGAVLYHIEVDWQHKQTKRSDQPLFQLIENLRTLSNLEQRLNAVVQATHEFVLPSRTNIYWFEPEKRYFWLRVSNQLFNLSTSNNEPSDPGITVQELSDFYYNLSVNEIVSIGEGRSSLKSHLTGKLMQRLQVRSLLAAPIILQKDLLGFVAVEGKEARIWTEAEKNFVKGAAGLISLVIPSEGMENTVKKIQQDAKFTNQVAQSIYNHSDFEKVLNDCAAQVLQRLTATRFLLLQYNPHHNRYQILYQSQTYGHKPVTFALAPLNKVDYQLLQHATEAVSIENIEGDTSGKTKVQTQETVIRRSFLLRKESVEDLRFFNWHSCLVENGVRSLLIANCAQGHAPEVLLVITTEIKRCWTMIEKELVQVVSQQIGVMNRQWQLYQQTEQQQKILLSFQQCLRSLAQPQNATSTPVQQLERVVLEQIGSVLNCPLVILLSWMPGHKMAQILPGVMASSRFAIVADTPISLQTEALIQWALAMDGMLTLNINDLPLTTKQWLNGESIGQILVMALRTSADHEPTGVVVMADHLERDWSRQSLSATETLIHQLAWLRRHLQMIQVLQSKTEDLQPTFRTSFCSTLYFTKNF
jgi:GAF domain-containing protein